MTSDKEQQAGRAEDADRDAGAELTAEFHAIWGGMSPAEKLRALRILEGMARPTERTPDHP